MPARDELEAMRARIETLERDLSDTEADRTKERLALERKLAEAQLELARARESAHTSELDRASEPPASATTPPTSAATPPAKGKRWLALIPVIVLAVVIAGYLGSRPSFEGSLEVRSGGDAWTLRPTACSSGDGARPEYFGATLRDEGGGSARIEPARVIVSRPGADAITLYERDCEVFDVHLEWGSARVERVESIDGQARLDCTLADGTRVRGSFDFQTCSL